MAPSRKELPPDWFCEGQEDLLNLLTEAQNSPTATVTRTRSALCPTCLSGPAHASRLVDENGYCHYCMEFAWDD